jgi:hypothetical protein
VRKESLFLFTEILKSMYSHLQMEENNLFNPIPHPSSPIMQEGDEKGSTFFQPPTAECNCDWFSYLTERPFFFFHYSAFFFAYNYILLPFSTQWKEPVSLDSVLVNPMATNTPLAL